jgi:hypothetical protein
MASDYGVRSVGESRPRRRPADPDELTLLAVDTRTPYTTDFNGADAGKTGHYMLRWVTTTGAKEPRSETASATVGA